MDRTGQRSRRHVPGWVRVAVVPLVAVAVVLGVWFTGAVLTEDAVVAMVLTGAFLTAGFVVALLVARRWRPLAWPVLLTYVVVAGGLGGYLLLTSSRDVTVDEEVTVAVEPAPAEPPSPAAEPAPSAAPAPAPSAEPAPPAPAGPVALSSGTFTSVAHETTGTATLVQRPDGSRVVTLTGFATDPGPDLRVYLVPGDGTDVDGYVDLSALRGNEGDQEYEVPADAPVGALVVWCRAFSVNFGYATLA